MTDRWDKKRIGVSHYLRACVWYLARPGLWLEFLRRMHARLLQPRPSDTREEAGRWCQERAINISEAIATITGTPMAEPVRERFRDVFVRADEAVRACPVTMGGAGELDLLYWIAERFGAESVIETGVAYGWSSLVILLALKDRDKPLLISTDRPYINLNNDEYVGCVVPDELKAHWEIIPQADRDALPKALARRPQIDICHYDSDKSYQGRMWAYPRLWKALKPGGCFISDDVGDDFGFRDFCAEVGVDPIIVKTPSDWGTKYVGVLIKSADAADKPDG